MANGVGGLCNWKLAVCVAVAALAGCASSPSVRLSDLTAAQQRADAAYAHHDWRSAVGAYQALTRAVPGNAAYWFRLGNSYAHLNQPMPAVAAYQAALQRDPHIVPAWHNLGAVLLQQSQEAFREAAGQAKPGDPLKQDSSLLARRIAAVRAGASKGIPHVLAPSAEPQATPATAASAAQAPPQGGGR